MTDEGHDKSIVRNNVVYLDRRVAVPSKAPPPTIEPPGRAPRHIVRRIRGDSTGLHKRDTRLLRDGVATIDLCYRRSTAGRREKTLMSSVRITWLLSVVADNQRPISHTLIELVYPRACGETLPRVSRHSRAAISFFRFPLGPPGPHLESWCSPTP